MPNRSRGYYSETYVDPESLVSPSKTESILEGVVAGVTAPLAMKARVDERQKYNQEQTERMQRLARVLRSSLMQQGFSPEEASAGALMYVEVGPEALENAVLSPAKAAQEIRKNKALAGQTETTANVMQQTALPAAQADIASKEAGTAKDTAEAAAIPEKVDIERQKAGTEQFKAEFTKTLGLRAQDLAEMKFMAEQADANNDGRVDEAEFQGLFEDTLKRVRSDYEKKWAEWNNADQVTRIREQLEQPVSLGEDELRAQAHALATEEAERVQGDRQFISGGYGLGNKRQGGAGATGPAPVSDDDPVINSYEDAVRLINERITDPAKKARALATAKARFGVQ